MSNTEMTRRRTPDQDAENQTSESTSPHSTHESDPEIIQRHKDLIDGIKAWYNVLIRLRYIKPDEIYQPPHHSSSRARPAVAVRQLQLLGFDDEVVRLAHHLPWPCKRVLCNSYVGHGLPILPGQAAAVTYLDDAGTEVLACLRDPLQLGKRDTAPWALAFTHVRPGKGAGDVLVYDTRDRTLTAWPRSDYDNLQENHVEEEKHTYLAHPRRPAVAVLAEIMANFEQLAWLPSREEDRFFRIERVPDWDAWAAKHAHTLAAATTDGRAAASVQLARDGCNRFHAYRNIFLRCGWPDHFDGEAFERESTAWMEELRFLEEVVEYKGRMKEIADRRLPQTQGPVAEMITRKLDLSFQTFKTSMLQKGRILDAEDFDSFMETPVAQDQERLSEFLRRSAGESARSFSIPSHFL